MTDLLTPEQLAERWQIHSGSLARWRSQGKGPTYVKLDGKIRYRLEDILEYELNNLIKPGEKNAG